MYKKISLLVSIALLCTALSGCAVFHTDPLANDNGSLTYVPNTDTSLWLLMGRDLKMNHEEERPEVQQSIAWYMVHRVYIVNIAKNASPYVYFVLQEVKKRDMPTEIALIPMIESNYDPFAYSDVGAAGLWQMMPGTASGFSIRQNWWYDGRRDVYASTQAALDYLVYLHKLFHGDWLLAIAAYNSGEGTVRNAIAYNQSQGLATDFWDLNLPLQTRNYVPKFLAISAILADPDKYPIQWPNTNVTPFLESVPVGSQIDLAQAAKLAGISTKQLYELNPGYSRWATDPDGQHILLLPADKAEQFKANLAKLPTSQRVTWQRYTVKPGDTLLAIAHHYQTTAQLIKQINNMSNNIIRPGQTLLIPRAQKVFAKEVMTNVQHYLQNQTTFPGPQNTTYTVVRGDSLEKIAKTYRVSENDLRFWNQLPSKAFLKPGTILTIWPPQNKRHEKSTTIRPYLLEHTVVSGEKLALIAKSYQISVADLKKANHLTTNTIRIGQTLIIPPSIQKLGTPVVRTKVQNYTVKSGDSIISIAHQFNVSTAQLKQLNQLTANKIKIGQMLKIPTGSA